MRYGPTSLQLSSVLAKGLRRPKLREDLRISEQQVLGETSFVLKIPETYSYNRYGPTEYGLLKLCDGTRTAAEVAAAITEANPSAPLTESDVLEFLDGTQPALWEQSVGDKNLAVLERIRDERKSRVDQSNLLYISFKAWNPDKTLARLDPYLSWMFTPGFAYFSIGIFAVAMSILADDWTRVSRDTANLYSFNGKSAYDIWAFWFLMLLLGAVHEFGHGLTCKHFGGEVPQMGFLLIYFTPAFFTDTTDILIFDTAKPRLYTIFAGIWIELVACSISTIIWAVTLPGSIANDLAYKFLLLSGIEGVLINLNPLIKADGYYALAQFLQMDSLREDSFEYLQAWGRKYLLFQNVELPAASRRMRRIFLVFGLSAVVYSYALLVVMLLFVNNIFLSKMGDWGYVATLGLLYFMLRNRLSKLVPRVRGWYWKGREEYMRWKMTGKQQLAAAAVAFVLIVPPFSATVASDFILEPGAGGDVRTSVAGQLTQVFARPGDAVHKGEVLAELSNPEVTAHAAEVASELGIAEANVRNAEEGSARDAQSRAQQERTRLLSELAIARAKVAGLEIIAPVDGAIAVRETEPRHGEYLNEGQEFAQIVDRSTMRARILVHDSELEYVKIGAPVHLQVRAHAYRTYDGHIERILPAAAVDRPVTQPNKLERNGQELTNYVAVEMRFPNPDGSLIEGMTGAAKISGHRRPVAWSIGESVWRWIRSQVW